MAHYSYFIKNVENYQHFEGFNKNFLFTLKVKTNKFFIGIFAYFVVEL